MREIIDFENQPKQEEAGKESPDEIRRKIDRIYENKINEIKREKEEIEERVKNGEVREAEYNRLLKNLEKKAKDAEKEKMAAYADRGLIKREEAA